MTIRSKLNQTFLQNIGLMAVLLLPVAFWCRLEIHGVCASRPPTAHCVSVNLFDRLGTVNKPKSFIDR